MTKKFLYKAEIGLPEPEYKFLQRYDALELMPVSYAYRYAHSQKQAKFLFEKAYLPDSILKITKEVKK